MSSNQFILYDLASKPPSTAWSLNPWKTRLLLNYKGLDYTTQWLEYPNIRPTLEPHCPLNDLTGTWTIPTVKFPDGSYLMDSRKIATRIETEHPSPSVHLESPILTTLESLMPRLLTPLRPVYLTTVPQNILSDASIEYWVTTRTKMVGKPLDELAQEQGGRQAWEAAQPVLHEVEALLRESEGPFFLGRTVSYADFVWVGFLIFLQRNGVLEELYKVSGDAQLHRDVYEATAPYHARNDH